MGSRKFADSMMPFLKKYKTYNKREEILVHYGLETIYIAFTKMFVITIISIILGITKEMYIFLFLYGFLRMDAGGLHLSTSMGCLISSAVTFIGGTYACMYLNTSLPISLLICLLTLLVFIKYSPADTKKKPIIRAENRKKRKYKSIIFVLIYTAIIIFCKNQFLQNVVSYSLLLQAFITSPVAYKIFNQPYNNYLIYGNYKRKED